MSAAISITFLRISASVSTLASIAFSFPARIGQNLAESSAGDVVFPENLKSKPTACEQNPHQQMIRADPPLLAIGRLSPRQSHGQPHRPLRLRISAQSSRNQ